MITQQDQLGLWGFNAGMESYYKYKSLTFNLQARFIYFGGYSDGFTISGPGLEVSFGVGYRFTGENK